MPCIIPFICCSESLAQTWSICNAELLRRGWWLQKGVAYTCWRDHCGYRKWLSALHRPKISSGNFGRAKRTSGYFRSVVFSKYPGVTCTWVEQELEEMALFLQILNETVNSPGGGIFSWLLCTGASWDWLDHWDKPAAISGSAGQAHGC